MYDVVVIGSGPSGVTCGIYLKRFGHNVLVIGGNDSNLSYAKEIENYYGFNQISGKELFSKGIEQLKNLEVPYYEGLIVEINYNGSFFVYTKDKTFEAKYLVLATGKPRRKLNVRNAIDYEMKGISYCAVCDGFLYRKKKIGLIGYNEFMEHELGFLKNLTKDIIIFTNGHEYQNPEFKVVTDKIESFYGKDEIEGINTTNGQYSVDGVFVAIGQAGTFEIVKQLGLKLDKTGSISVSSDYETNFKNVFAVGDAIDGVKQINHATYTGMMAAYALNERLKD